MFGAGGGSGVSPSSDSRYASTAGQSAANRTSFHVATAKSFVAWMLL